MLLLACPHAGAAHGVGRAWQGRLLFSVESENTETGDTITSREVWSLPGIGQDLRSITVTYAKLKGAHHVSLQQRISFEVRVVYQLQGRQENDGSWRITGEQKTLHAGRLRWGSPLFLGVRVHVLGTGTKEAISQWKKTGKTACCGRIRPPVPG